VPWQKASRIVALEIEMIMKSLHVAQIHSSTLPSSSRGRAMGQGQNTLDTPSMPRHVLREDVSCKHQGAIDVRKRRAWQCRRISP
jgi:hypothetical protein